MSTHTTRHRMPRTTLAVLGICALTVIFDGYDLIVYGAVVPSLLKDPAWHLTPMQAGAIGSWTLAGMLAGALIAGTITDLIGRRRLMLVSITWFSVAIGCCALAPTPGALGLLRFLAGLGLGVVTPTASALILEYAPPGRKNFVYALMFSGIGIGGLLSAILSLALVPAFGWRVILIGAAPLVVVLPLAYRFLPESIAFLHARGRRHEAAELARRHQLPLDELVAAESTTARRRLRSMATLFSREHIAATVLFWLATAVALLLIFALNTWLPQLMRKAGFDLGSAVLFLLVLNLGAVLGTIGAARVADRVGSKPVVTIAFLAAAGAIVLLSARLATPLTYLLAAVAGVGTTGTQILINGYVARHYPVHSRASALGWSLGVGRVGAIVGPTLGGVLLSSDLDLAWNFRVFALIAVAGALIIAFVPKSLVAGPAPGNAPPRGAIESVT